MHSSGSLADVPLQSPPDRKAAPYIFHGQTTSLCETCLETVPAKVVIEDAVRELELRETLARNRHVGKPPEPRRDPVNGVAAADGLFDRAARGFHGPPRGRGEVDPHAPAGDGDEVIEREAGAREQQAFHSKEAISYRLSDS